MRIPLLLSLLVANVLAADAPRWWKGNLHTHSLWSDGDDYPEMIATWYKERGYHFLGLSDHNTTADQEKWIEYGKTPQAEAAFAKYAARFPGWIEQREMEGRREVRLKMFSEWRTKLEEPGRFLTMPSEEVSAKFGKIPIHMNATNLREFIAPRNGNSVVEVIQNNINAVLEQRKRTGVPMIPHVNHPNFGWAITAEELMQVENDRFFEVYNGHPKVYNDGDVLHAGTDRVWDIILTERLAVLGKEPLFGLGVDDSHHYHNEPKKDSRPGRGWIMVRAAQLNAENLIAAMEAGDFYASSGVTLTDVRLEKDKLSIEIAAEAGVEYTTEFIGTRRGYDPKSEPVPGEDGGVLRVTRKYSPSIGAVLATVKGASASYPLKGDEIYVRARITSTKPKPNGSRPGEFERAWTQPLVPGA
jgi:hypothetical protein